MLPLGPRSQLPGQRRNAAWDHGPNFPVSAGMLPGTTVPPLPSVPECCLGPRSQLPGQRRNAAWDHGPTFTVSTGMLPGTMVPTSRSAPECCLWDHGPTFTVSAGMLPGTTVPSAPSVPELHPRPSYSHILLFWRKLMLSTSINH